MKKFILWLVSFLQFLSGAVFVAALLLRALNVYDMIPQLDGDALTYVLCGLGGLYVLLYLVETFYLLRLETAGYVLVGADNTFVAKVSVKKIRKLAAAAAKVAAGVSLKKLFIDERADGRYLKLSVNIKLRRVSDAVNEYRIILADQLASNYGVLFDGIDIRVGKVKNVKSALMSRSDTSAEVKAVNSGVQPDSADETEEEDDEDEVEVEEEEEALPQTDGLFAKSASAADAAANDDEPPFEV